MNQSEIICDAFFKISNFMIFGVFCPLLASKMLIFTSVAALPRNAIRLTHMVRSTLLRLPLMGPLRAIPGGPPASMAWTPLTQGSPHQIDGFQKKLDSYPHHF